MMPLSGLENDFTKRLTQTSAFGRILDIIRNVEEEEYVCKRISSSPCVRFTGDTEF
jgi:hypothetical protein